MKNSDIATSAKLKTLKTQVIIVINRNFKQAPFLPAIIVQILEHMKATGIT